MKRLLFVTVCLVLVAAFSAPASAQSAVGPSERWITLGNGGLTGVSTAVFGLSNNVWMCYSTANNYQDYALGDKHRAGNREFYTTNNTTVIYFWESDTYKGQSSLANSGSGMQPGSSSLSGSAL